MLLKRAFNSQILDRDPELLINGSRISNSLKKIGDDENET
jgi:hypothetical protein